MTMLYISKGIEEGEVMKGLLMTDESMTRTVVVDAFLTPKKTG